MIPPTLPELPRFEILRPLGTGGGGAVHLVRDRAQHGAFRALKLGLPEDRDGAAAVRAGLIREARALAALRHPALPRLFDVGIARDGTPWLLLEHVDGVAPPRDRDAATLRGHVVATARSLFDVLAYLHRHGWLHRDVKPQNVLTTAAGRVVLLDFGLAEREDVVVPARGTLPFVAPEVLAGEDVDPRSDIFGAGAALLVLATGITFPPDTHLGPEFVPDDALLPPAWLRSLVQPRRDARPESAERALADLDAALGRAPSPLVRRALPHAPVPAGRTTEIETIVRRMRDSRASAASVAGVVTDAAAPAVPGIVLVRGTSGVGKSRLLQELRLRAVGEGWAPIHGSCSDERDSRMPALRSILTHAALLAGPGSHALQRQRRSGADDVDGGPGAPADVAADAGAAAPHDDAPGTSRVGPRRAADPAEAAARFLAELAHELGGLVLVVEDLQDATALSVRVIATLARRIAEGHALGSPPPLLVVATLTDGAPVSEEVEEGLRSLEAEGLVQTLPLRPLGPDDIAGLVRGVLGPRAPHDRVAEVLRAHGGALPLFAEELLARLVDDGALRHDGSRWMLDPRHTPTLPETLTGAMRARLERLLPPELRAVQLLATYELPVPRTAVDRMVGDAAAALL
ncbi:MAG: AAA family ATPase, partial [Planctomycetes bacterium]|nr:AAA family ATPase [Planctomycetota bacterium]